MTYLANPLCFFEKTDVYVAWKQMPCPHGPPPASMVGSLFHSAGSRPFLGKVYTFTTSDAWLVWAFLNPTVLFILKLWDNETLHASMPTSGDLGAQHIEDTIWRGEGPQ